MQNVKFDQIFQDLKEKIESGEYPFHSLMPSENFLTKKYGCVRNTVRRALAELIKRGYIQSQQGKRPLVIYEPVVRNTFLIGGIESFKEAAARNHFTPFTQVIRFDKIIADEQIAEKTCFPLR